MVNRFLRSCVLTIAALIALILVGGIVRATGSGMGCPDWPKCFGLWIPPLSESELPVNYKEIFGEKLKGEVIFNPTKTWIEYINRLLGALIGLFIIITTLISFKAFFRRDKRIFWYCFASLILVLVEGWLGSKVVSTELHPLLITLHMLLSIVILGLLILAYTCAKQEDFLKLNIEPHGPLSFLLSILLILMVFQIGFGTQIREGIDAAQKILGDNNRAEWVKSVNGKMLFHGGISILILLLSILINVKSVDLHESAKKLSKIQLMLIILSVVSGAILGFAGFPAIIQPLHLVLSILIISTLFFMFFLLNPKMILNGK